MPRNEYGICAQRISPLCASTTWNSWMRSRFSASATSSSSASPRVPTSEKLCSRCPSAKSSQAAANSRLSCARALRLRAPPRRVELQERVLDEVARLTAAIIAAAFASRPLARRLDAAPSARVPRVRIALLSPYSWTYPGGVTRHIDALAAELAARGPRRARARALRPRRCALAPHASRRATAGTPAQRAASSRSGARSDCPPTAPSRTYR